MAATARRVKRRDGYVDAIVALGRARIAAAQIAAGHAAFHDALGAVRDAAAATGDFDSWLEVCVAPFGERGMPHPADLAFGYFAEGVLEAGVTELDADGIESELAELEQLIRAAISHAGPTDTYQATLDALWKEGKDGR